MDINFYGAYIRAGATKRRGKRQIGILAHVEIGSQDGANRAGSGIVVAMSPTAPVYRAGIEAGATANTF